MNQPHLRFEITSDDGFSVKASSIEGKNVDLGCVDSKRKRNCTVLTNSAHPPVLQLPGGQ